MSNPVTRDRVALGSITCIVLFCGCTESGHQVNAELWPAALSSAIPHVIKLLDDVLVDSNKTAG
jgi:hypothetical protein